MGVRVSPSEGPEGPVRGSGDDKHALRVVLFGPIDPRKAGIPAVIVQAVNFGLGLLFRSVRCE